MEWGGAWCYAPVQGVEWGGGSPGAWRYAPVQGCLKLEASCAIKDSDLVGTALFQNPDPAGPQGDLPRIHAALGLDRSLDLFVVNEWLLLSPRVPSPGLLRPSLRLRTFSRTQRQRGAGPGGSCHAHLSCHVGNGTKPGSPFLRTGCF